VLIPIVFLFSAIVSGIALVVLLYMIITPLTGGKINMKCVDKAVDFLFYAVIVDFSLEMVDFHPPGLPERGGDQDPLRDGHEQAVREPHHHPGPFSGCWFPSCSSPSRRSSRSASA